jgi:hypothetical protein
MQLKSSSAAEKQLKQRLQQLKQQLRLQNSDSATEE